jgi:acyl carrier protein
MESRKMENEILAMLKEIQPDYPFENEADFIERGWLDSFDVISLVSELEEKFSIVISALEIVPENFVSIPALRALVQRSKKVDRGN